MRYELILLNVFNRMKTMNNQSDKSQAPNKLVSTKDANFSASNRFTHTPSKTGPKDTSPLGSALNFSSTITDQILRKRESSGDVIFPDVSAKKKHRRSNWRLNGGDFIQVDPTLEPMTGDALPAERKTNAAQIIDRKLNGTENEMVSSAGSSQGMQL